MSSHMPRRRALILLFTLTFVLMMTILSTSLPAADETASPATAPVAKREPHATEIHGKKLVDEYHWLRNKPDPRVREYLEAENAYADSVMGPTKPLQEKLYNEMLSRIKETDVNVPYKLGGYFYYSRTEKGKQYPIFCRKKGSTEAAEEVTLDVNELAKGHQFMSIGAYQVSDDGNLLAYTTDNTGFRQYTMAVKDLRTGKLLADRAEKVGSVVWAADNQTIFYTMEDAAKRQYRLYRHTVSATGADGLLYEEKDEKFSVEANRTRSKKYILLTSGSLTTSEVRYLPADQPMAEWKLVAPRVAGQEYYADHHGESFYIRTNDQGRNFRLVKAPVADGGREKWQEVIAHRPEVLLSGVSFFANHYVAQEREGGLPHLRVTDLRTSKWHRVKFPEAAYVVYQENNREFDANQFRYSYQSFITPNSVYDYDMDKQAAKLLKQTEVLGGYDAKKYQTERIHATAKDGVKVPVSLVYLKGLKRDGTAPIYLTAYGSYGIPNNISFSSNRFSLVDRGAVFAVAHIRGGGDLGKPWHDDGRMMKKMNTFTDFIASAEHLVAQKYGTKDKLVIQGGSAGGLLMGAVTNLRPDLFKAVVTKVPFVDVINTMLDESLPLTVGEFEEWGNPKNKAAFDYMLAYSPYDQLAAKEYPAILVTTSFNDSQVMYWEPAKYVAKLRTLKKDKNPLILKTNMGAGHGGASGRYDFLRELAYDYSFVLWQMGIKE